jgi:hypothetical protein
MSCPHGVYRRTDATAARVISTCISTFMRTSVYGEYRQARHRPWRTCKGDQHQKRAERTCTDLHHWTIRVRADVQLCLMPQFMARVLPVHCERVHAAAAASAMCARVL